MEDNTMAYVAGLIDGDGSISLTRKMEAGAKSPLFIPMIQLSKGSPALSSFLKDTFGGSVTISDRTSGYRTKKEYKWRLAGSKGCRVFLESVSRYLKNKKEQAEELLRYINSNPFVRGSNPLTEDTIIEREKCYTKMISLNAARDTMSRIKRCHYSKQENDFFWQYFAGLLDTDGSFSIKREKGYKYSPCILLSSVNANSINFIQRNCMYGTVFLVKSSKVKQKFFYRFGAYTRNDAIQIIKNVLPYLKHKAESAKCLLEFCEGFVAECGLYKKTEQQKLFRETMYAKIIDANNGLSKSPLIVLKTLPGSAEGNKEQAGHKPCSLNAVSEVTPKGDAVL